MGRKPALAVGITLVLLAAALGAIAYRSFASIPELFRLNAKLKADGYYMAEFEFKMVGIAYYLDKGRYATAFSRLNQVRRELETGEGLVKLPGFSCKQEELEFYLGLQNPRTGAFMDDSYPLCTYVGPTTNTLNHLAELARETGQPLRLKYPLRFFDQIDTPEKLEAYLNDLATVGRLATLLPITPNVLSIEVASGDIADTIEANGLYAFSPQWKRALLRWFYENQDSRTGYWGPRSRRDNRLLGSGELTITGHIVQLFVDKEGNDRHPEFPLRYKDEMFATTLEKLGEPMPEDHADQHVWSVAVERGIRLLTLLWPDASPDSRSAARQRMEEIVRVKFEKCYVPARGAFSLYAGSTDADLDGTGEALALLKRVGALSLQRQELLWGRSDERISDLGQRSVAVLTEPDLRLTAEVPGLNSIRFYPADPGPDGYAADVLAVVYPRDTPVLDVMELGPKVAGWIAATPQRMGNYVSRDALAQMLAGLDLRSVPVARGEAALGLLNKALERNRKLVAVGFDLLQIPRCKVAYCVR